MDLLIEISEVEGKLTHEQIREETDTFMFEVSFSLTFFFLEIVTHWFIEKLLFALYLKSLRKKPFKVKGLLTFLLFIDFRNKFFWQLYSVVKFLF